MTGTTRGSPCPAARRTATGRGRTPDGGNMRGRDTAGETRAERPESADVPESAERTGGTTRAAATPAGARTAGPPRTWSSCTFVLALQPIADTFAEGASAGGAPRMTASSRTARRRTAALPAAETARTKPGSGRGHRGKGRGRIGGSTVSSGASGETARRGFSCQRERMRRERCPPTSWIRREA